MCSLLNDIVQQHQIAIQSYVDDTQLYDSLDHRDMSSMSEAVKSFKSPQDMDAAK